jgi:adsorption protein B
MLTLIAGDRHDGPFDAESLTEDYELGLRIAALGGRGTLARVRDWPRGRVAVVRAYFPSTMDTAVRQKARWMTGIALAGWDRVGWGRWYQLGEHWMRMRDRRAPLAVLLLVAAYVALVGSAISTILHSVPGIPASGALAPVWLVVANAALLLWRLAVRAWFTGRDYGPVEALLSAPRMVVGNVISMFAARRAVIQYVQMLRGAAPRWDKTAHVFPDVTPPGANP